MEMEAYCELWLPAWDWILHVYGQRASLDDTMGRSCSSVRDTFMNALCDYVLCVSGFCMSMGNALLWMTLCVYIPLQFVNLLCDWCGVCEWILHVYGQRASLDDTMGISCSSVRDSFVCAWCDCYE